MTTDLLCNYGQHLKELERFGRSRECLAEALQISQRLGTAELLTSVHGNLASMLEAVGDWDAARDQHERHRAVARGIDDVGGANSGSIGIARCDLAQGRTHEALEKLAAIEWPGGKKTIAARILEARGLHAVNRFAEALRALNDASTESLESDDPYWLGQLMMCRVELALEGLPTGTMKDDVEVAVRQTRELSERWPASFPLKRERARAMKLKERVEAFRQ